MCAIRPFLVLPGLISAALPHVLIVFDMLLSSVRERLRALLSKFTRTYCSGNLSSWFYINRSFVAVLTKACFYFLS